MNAITYNAWHPRHLGYVIVSTALLTGFLFAALPWLTRVANREQHIERASPYIILSKTQPKPPEPVRDQRIIEQELQPPPKPSIQPNIRQNKMPDFEVVITQSGDGPPMRIKATEKMAPPDWEGIIFDPSQLDKEPHLIQKIPPAYPFTAKSLGITARVKIKCIIDKYGNPQKIVVAECDPEDALDIFGPPAVEAVKKWRFSPGEIGGDPVPTRVAFNIFFELD